MADEKKQENTGIVEYESNGEIVKISPTTVRKYLVSGGGNVSDQEVMMFMSLCRYQHLNPFLKEAYLIKFGKPDNLTHCMSRALKTSIFSWINNRARISIDQDIKLCIAS